MRTLKFTLQYDGTGLVGWQRQASGTSVQGLLEDALGKIEGCPVAVYGAGRTDAGVHALAQIAHARLTVEHYTETMIRAMNANLPEAVRVVDVTVAPDDFHARFSARSKTYEYRIWNAGIVPPFQRLYVWHVPLALDVAVMRAAAAAIAGEHDFAAFQGVGTPVHSTVRRIIDVGQLTGTVGEHETIELYAQLGQLEGDVLGRVDEAVDAWRKVIAIDPSDFRALAAQFPRHRPGRIHQRRPHHGQ